MKGSVNILIAILVITITISCDRESGKIIGIKIYEYDDDFTELIAKWKDMGINTAFISKELGTNEVFRTMLKKNNIAAYIIFPVFYNPDILKQDSTLYSVTNKGLIARDSWVEFVCPSRIRYRQAKVTEAAGLVKELNPDGLSIDFIRQFVFWEMIYPGKAASSIDRACFCDSCIFKFCNLNHLLIPDSCLSRQQKARFILNSYSEAWDNYRCDLIASMVKEISDTVHSIAPRTRINIHAVPWRDEDFNGANINVAAQDLRKIAPYADFISPMCYSQMVRRDARWIESVVSDMDKKAPGMILPSIQVYPYYIDDPFSAEDFKNCYLSALKPPSRGVVFFSWPLFQEDSARMDIIR